jgi:addiction module HigA family antidote
MIVSYRDKRTADFAAGRRVKAFSGLERPARLKLDRVEAAVGLQDLAALPGNRFEVFEGRSKRTVQHPHQRSVADLLRMAGQVARTNERRDRGLPLRSRIMARRAIHPGEHLAEELEELDMSAAELARRLQVPTNRVTAILNGQRAITGDTALRLAHFFGTSAQFWLNLQNLYELRLAEDKSGKSIKRLPTLKDSEAVHA